MIPVSDLSLPDRPFPFAWGMAWFAIRSAEPQRIASELRLQKSRLMRRIYLCPAMGNRNLEKTTERVPKASTIRESKSDNSDFAPQP
jgi:hypothetical protein